MLYMLPDLLCPRPCDKCQASPAFPYASPSLEHDYATRIQVTPEQITWMCEACWLHLVCRDEEPVEVRLPYEHPHIRPGLNGMISKRIQEVLPGCLLAGKLIRTCTGLYSLRSDFSAERMLAEDGHSMNYRLNHHLFRVPVYDKDDDPSIVRLMPEQYVLID